jgi:hypothetical protein
MRRRIDDFCGMFGLVVGGLLIGALAGLYWDEPLPLATLPVFAMFGYGWIWVYRRHVVGL